MDLITAQWPAPPQVRGFTTTRGGGVSPAPWASLNLGAAVGDLPGNVATNRERLAITGGLPGPLHWPRQVHGIRVLNRADLDRDGGSEADAVYTNEPDTVCAILTADCLPIIVCAANGSEIAVIHAGWRGLLDGIVAAAVAHFAAAPAHLLAWIGPGISAPAYAVDDAFEQRFIRANAAYAEAFHRADGQPHADLSFIAAWQLRDAGLPTVCVHGGCTFGESDRFFSYRRDGTTGRMATCAWFGEAGA